MAQNSKIEWTEHTANLWWGCTKVHEGCKNCLEEGTLVLKSDFSWVAIEKLRVGDELISFNEKGKSLRRYELSKVEKVWKTKARAVEIITDNTRIVASYNHKFLSGTGRLLFASVDSFNMNTKITYTPMYNGYLLSDSDSYKKGYIAGATLGDGTFNFKKEWENVPHRSRQRYWRIAVNATQIEFLQRLRFYVKNLTGYDVSITKFNSGGANRSPMIQVGTRKTQLLSLLFDIINIKERDLEFKRGWLSGMFDAEGNYSKYKKNNGDIRVNALRIAQVDVGVLQIGVDYAKALGFDFCIDSKQYCSTMRIIGGVKSAIRFLSVIRPSISYKTDSIYGSFCYYEKDGIESMTDVGEKNLIDIQTSTRTFIANGLLTHNCYAEALSLRFDGGKLWGNENPRKQINSVWNDFTKFQRLAKEANQIHRVFVGSMMDIFEKPMPLVDNKGNNLGIDTGTLRNRFFKVVVPASPNLMFLLLTKRPSNINKYIPESWKNRMPHNVMFGTSPVNQKTADTLIPQLLEVEGKRFLSIEPQLDDIELRAEWLKGLMVVINGGESGAHKRHFDCDWARNLRDQCSANGVPYFFKQIDGVKIPPSDLINCKQFPLL